MRTRLTLIATVILLGRSCSVSGYPYCKILTFLRRRSEMKMKFFAVTCLALFLSSGASASVFTLSDSALLSLDADLQSSTSTTFSRTDVAGSGVVFEIFYPGLGSELSPVSSTVYGGSGALTGIDISGYDSFALDFTLLSVNGQTDYSNYGGPLIAGAVINGIAVDYRYKPEVLGFVSFPSDVTSITPTLAETIETVGFSLNVPTWWYDEGESPWNPAGNTVQVLVSAAEGATVIPEPATLLLMGTGLLVIRRKK